MMEGLSKKNVLNVLRKELVDLAEFGKNNEKEIEDNLQENLDFLRRMVSQVPGPNDGPLLPKTPKVNRKNPIQRIETIHEDELVEFEVTRPMSIASEQAETNVENVEDDNTSNRRSRRTASKKAASSIKQQQSLTLNGKLRRPQTENDNKKASEQIEDSSDSSEEENNWSLRQSRTRKPSIQKKKTAKNSAVEKKTDSTFVLEATGHKEENEPLEKKQRVSSSKRKHNETRSPSPFQLNEYKRSRTPSGEPAAKKANLINETLEKSSLDDTLESSIYEDAIGRPAPIHNSTKIIDTTLTLESKSSTSSKTSDLTKIIDTTLTLEPKSSASSKISVPKSKDSPNSLKTMNRPKMNVTVVLESLSKPAKNSAISEDRLEDEDLVGCTPEVKSMNKTSLQQGYRAKVLKPGKNAHKANALFSPYATDSVRKRVEAFEQAGLNSPNPVTVDVPTRVTRTKTRAMAAAEASVNSTQSIQPVQSITQKLARKSLAKAKKISLAKQIKDTDEGKENETLSSAATKANRLLAINEKLMQKLQLRITPIAKSRLQQPMSVNHLQTTPSNIQLLSSHSKAMSASRTNIIMSMDSFLPSTKQAQKLSLAEKLEEKQRKANEKDARRKKDEVLRAVTEEKKRKREEKELKNKLAREAKEKLDREKRLKAEKEREEKARIALQIQEKQREEAERKRLYQLQRAQEKEEKRKQEEQLRLQRLQEQEEMERQLAEQKRKEQEAAERQHQRRHAEAKAQQQALAEAAKIKAQYQSKQGKHLNNTHTLPKQVQAPTSYQIESEPDEDETSDNEDAPKYPVPAWANAEVRKEQLALQRYIPSFEIHRYFNSRQCTPDLTEIFENIDKRRLKRTSSAIWKTPPRYSMMYRE